jgi:peptide subunit release factor 1 (eRF1)
MVNLEKSGNRCPECNMKFDTKEKLAEHQASHSDVYCDTCPIDMAVRGISKLFRRNKHLS